MDTEHRSEESHESHPPSSSGGLTPVRTRGGGAAEEELRALYDAHALVLLGYALRLSDGDRAQAEDIVQETLVRAWRHLDQLDPSGGAGPAVAVHRRPPPGDRRPPCPARPPERGGGRGARPVPGMDRLEGTLDRIIVTDALESLSRNTAR